MQLSSKSYMLCNIIVIMKEINFSERIKELRKEKGLKQEDVAKSLNVTKATVSRWEASKVEPDYRTLVKLAKLFKVKTDYLLGLED